MYFFIQMFADLINSLTDVWLWKQQIFGDYRTVFFPWKGFNKFKNLFLILTFVQRTEVGFVFGMLRQGQTVQPWLWVSGSSVTSKERRLGKRIFWSYSMFHTVELNSDSVWKESGLWPYYITPESLQGLWTSMVMEDVFIFQIAWVKYDLYCIIYVW